VKCNVKFALSTLSGIVYIHVSVLCFVNLVKPTSYSDSNLTGFSIDYTRFAGNNTCLRNVGSKRIYEWKILITERKILRGIFEPREDGDGTWRIEKNKLKTLIINNNKIKYI
jgi:hypothetical protein